ncbi:hypothetical protein [Streptomyces sp. NPDC048527]|uniref:hypothetical protein n=1 Tax=Streptomyces sp. NPDC048527 TaxID=3365568 RepID=UPI0037117DB0
MDDPSPFARFGERTASLLEKWQQLNHRSLTPVDWLDAGGSGALLVSVFVQDRDPKKTKRRMIIKLCSPGGESSMEPGRLNSARMSLPLGDGSFTRDHLVEHLYDPMPVDDAWLMFQGLAGSGTDMVTLSTILRQQRLPGVAAEIVRSLLTHWNPDEHADGAMTAAGFVGELLDRRLEPDGPLAYWVRNALGLALDTPWIRLARRGSAPLPNPVHLGAGCALAGGVVSYPVRGRAHGDLHPGNIMVPADLKANAKHYVLIDLSRFDERALLARDPVHLLLCLVADFLPHLSDDARDELLELLVGRQTPGLLIPQGLQWTVDRIRQAPDGWLADRDISGEWRGQWMLSMQACALMFTARVRYDARDRWWFFRLAAEAAAEYLRAIGAYEPEEAVFVQGPPASVTGAPTAIVVPGQATPVESVSDGASAATPTVAEGVGREPILALLLDAREHLGLRLDRLRAQTAGSVSSETLQAIRQRTTYAHREIAARLDAAHHVLDEGTRDSVGAVLERLAHVTAMVDEPGFSPEQPSFLRDLAHRALIMAMDQLLGSVHEAVRGMDGPSGSWIDRV